MTQFTPGGHMPKKIPPLCDEINTVWLIKKIKTSRVRHPEPEGCCRDKEESARYWQGYNSALNHLKESIIRHAKRGL